MNRTDYIKRIVGLPGDRIQVHRTASCTSTASRSSARGSATMCRAATAATGPARSTARCCPTAGAHEIIETTDNGPSDNTPEFLVPAGQLFRDGRQPRQFARQPHPADGARRQRRDRASAPSSAGTCRPRTWSAAPSSSSSRTIRRPRAGWSHGNGRRRSASAACSAASIDGDRLTTGPRLRDAPRRSLGPARRRGADPSQRARPPARR